MLTTSPNSGVPLVAIIDTKKPTANPKILYLIPATNAEAEPAPVPQYTAEDLRAMTLTQKRRLRNELLKPNSPDISGPQSTYKTRLTETIQLLPSPQPDRIFVAGASGVGKSTWASMFILEYHLKNPENKIFMYSTHQAEHAYSALPIEYQPLESILPEAKDGVPTVVDYTNALVVFDDTDNIRDKKTQVAITGLQSDLLANGRKYGVSVLILAHQLMDFQRTRVVLNECPRIVFFPSGAKYHIQRFLKVYAGLTKSDIDRILSTSSRWICLQTSIPNIVIAEHDVFVL